MNLDFIFSSELFGVVLSLFTFYLGTRIQKNGIILFFIHC